MLGDRTAGAGPEPPDPRLANRALEVNPDRWYHTIELAPGVVTPGYIDMRRAAPKVLPDALAGVEALDVGTFDGFWAFELEKRGAAVTTLDLPRIEDADFPPAQRDRLEAQVAAQGFEIGTGFRLAAAALGSGVRRVECNVYELSPERIGSRSVDLAFVGAVLSHLRDPIAALERIRGVLRSGGELRVFEPISAAMTWRAKGRPAAEFRANATDYTWWLPNVAAVSEWIAAAGFGGVTRFALRRPPCAERTWYVAVRASAP